MNPVRKLLLFMDYHLRKIDCLISYRQTSFDLFDRYLIGNFLTG